MKFFVEPEIEVVELFSEIIMDDDNFTSPGEIPGIDPDEWG